MPSNTDTIGVQIESVTQIISHRLQGQGPPLQLTNTYERTAVLAASLLTHFTALLVCIKLHSAAQRSGAFALSYASSAGSAGILWRTREARISHHSSKSDVNPLRRNPKKLFKHFLILVHFVKMIDKDDLNFC